MNSLWAIAVFAFLIGVKAHAQDTDPVEAPTKPLWELGIAAGGIYSPDYPAADKNSLHGLALPNLIYRGGFFRMGRDSIAKGVFIDNDYSELNVSLAASFNANSSDNNARRGMSDLDYLGEIGPQLKIKIGELYGGKTELQLPVRAVFSTDFSRVDQRGFLFNPKLSHERKNIFNSRIDMSSSIGSSFATKKLHEYFYRVEPRFATATRPAYEADGGYLGSDITFGLSYGITDRVRAYAGWRTVVPRMRRAPCFVKKQVLLYMPPLHGRSIKATLASPPQAEPVEYNHPLREITKGDQNGRLLYSISTFPVNLTLIMP